jgi:hypothetical protein
MCRCRASAAEGRCAGLAEAAVSREALLADLRAEEEAWQALLEVAGAKRATLPGAVGSWSLKETLAHLAFWTHHAAGHAEGIAAGRVPSGPELWGEAPELSALGEEGLNGWVARRSAALTVPEVFADLRRAGDRLEAAVTRIGDEELNDPRRRFESLAWKGERTLAEVLALLTVAHSREHAAEVRAWLEGR